MKAIPVVLLCLLCHCSGSRQDQRLREDSLRNNSLRDQRLMERDSETGENVLTPLGCMVYGPWQTNFIGYNKAVYWQGKEISSVGVDYSPLQQDLVFELMQDGSVQFWFKHDYDSALAKRTSPDASGVTVTTNERHAESEIKKIAKTGTWKVDFRDSSLVIDFGKGNGISALKGKYKELGSDMLSLCEISYFDSTYPGGKATLKRVITTNYHHPWVNKF